MLAMQTGFVHFFGVLLVVLHVGLLLVPFGGGGGGSGGGGGGGGGCFAILFVQLDRVAGAQHKNKKKKWCCVRWVHVSMCRRCQVLPSVSK